MPSAEQYRARAQEFNAMANDETNHELQTEYTRMAQSYLRLADMAERYKTSAIVYGTPRRRDAPA